MKLKKLEVSAFGGIHPDSPVIIDFSDSRWITLSGDYGTGKSSLLNALLVATGQLSHTTKEGKEFVNNDSGKLDLDFEFVGTDRITYQVHCTKSKFELRYEGKAVPEPLTKMKSLLGVVGVSPMAVKQAPLKDIVKWLSSYSKKSAAEFENEMGKLKDGIKSARNARADANRIAKSHKTYLEAEDMYNDWEDSEARYGAEPDLKTLSTALNEARSNSDLYIRAEEKINRLQQDREKVARSIDELRAAIAAKEKEFEDINESIIAGEKYIEDNKDAKTKYEAVKERYDNVAADLTQHNKWKEIKSKKKELDEVEDLSQKADAKEKELLQRVKELQTEILPDIKGVDLVLEDTHEDGKLIKEGLYWEGKSAAQMSESEFWNFVLQVWRKFKVKVIVIDNLSSLGSKSIELLEKLHKEGAHILASEMNREQKELVIIYEDQPNKS